MKHIETEILKSYSFYKSTSQGKEIVNGKLVRLKSGEKIGIYKNGRRDSSSRKYRVCWCVTCLTTGVLLKIVNRLKDVLVFTSMEDFHITHNDTYQSYWKTFSKKPLNKIEKLT